MTIPPSAWPRIYVAIGLTTMATLLLELALTRIFSVVLFYHFAFLAISLAMFGLGVGAILSYYRSGATPERQPWARLGLLCAVNAPVTTAALWVVLRQQVEFWVAAPRLALIYFVSAVPFCLAGAVVSLALAAAVERVHRVYFFDLVGAALGCLLLVPLLNAGGGPSTVLAAATLYALAGAVWYSAAARSRPAAVCAALAVAFGVFSYANVSRRWVDLRFAKGQSVAWELFSAWNSFSRVAVKPDDGGGNPQIVIDADAATSIPGQDLDHLDDTARDKLLRSGPGLPYQMRPGARTLIIGPGGGYDVARALASGSRDVTGVEINPIIVNDIMRDRFAEHSRRLYFRPEVRIHVEDGRSFVRRSREKYQVIQMTLVDTWASTAAGAFSLSENNLYTVEAFVDYFEHLTDDGLLAVTRWGFEPPRESLRVVSLAQEALLRLGAQQPWRHFVVARQNEEEVAKFGALDTVVAKRSPLEPEEIESARQALAAARMRAAYLPDEPASNAYGELLRAADRDRFFQAYQYDVTPPTDNRPFFFYTVRRQDLARYVGGGADAKINYGVAVLATLLAASLLGTYLLLLLPPLVLGTRLPRERGALLDLAYFVAVGLGFILVEVALIQRFVRFLGNPTYSLTVVVFSLLVATGLGSAASLRLAGADGHRLPLALAAVAALVAMLGLAGPAALDAAVGWPVEARCALIALIVFPAGFAMGIPFPSGLRRLERRYPAAIRWAWAMNSAASVLGSVLAIFFAIHLGLWQTLLLGAAAYLVALFVVWTTPQRDKVAAGRAL